MSRRRTQRGSARPRRGPEPLAEAKAQVRPVRIVLTLGALAAAIGSILGLAPKVTALFHHPPPNATVRVTAATPMRYGQYLQTSGRSLRNHKDQLKVRGALIHYDIAANHVKSGADLPVRLKSVNGSEQERAYTIEAVPVTVQGPRCGCEDFVPAPRAHDRYVATVAVYAPGSESGDEAMAEDDVGFRQSAP